SRQPDLSSENVSESMSTKAPFRKPRAESAAARNSVRAARKAAKAARCDDRAQSVLHFARRGTPPRESGFSDFFAELSAFPPPDRIVGKATPRKKRGPIVDHRPTEKETDMERVQNPVR